MDYKLTLELDRVDDRYHLKARSHLGEAEADLVLPFSEVEERALLRALEQRRYDETRFPPEERQALRDLGVLKGSRLVNLLRTVGETLYGALTADDGVRQRIVSTLDAAKQARQPLQVEMRFGAGTDRLARLPWELVCDRGHFLVQDTTIALSRYPEAAEPVTESLGDLPLRVLLVISRPAGVVPLDPEKERRALLHGLRTLAEEEDVVVDVLRPPTQEMLAEAVTTGGYHVVHFDGHGAFALECPECEAMNAPERATCDACGTALDEAEAQGYLVFEDEYGGVQRVSADEMAAALRNTEVRLVVLSACQTAVTAAEGMWTGVAPALLRAGVPLVVAMQCSVPADTAATFARQFYASLAHGKPLIEAVADGRRPLVGRRYNNTWFIPVLYARTAAPPPSPPTLGGKYRLFRPRPSEEAEVTPERADLRRELRQRRAELDGLEEATARQGAVFDPAQMAALRGLRSQVAELRSRLAGVEARGVARPTSVLYGVPSNPYFVGRADEMRNTVKALEERQVVVVWGTAGIGKSALATEMAHRHSWRWPGGVLWLSCQDGPAFETLLNQMGAFCGQDLSQADPARKPELVRGLLAGLEDGLLIWDNYEDVEADEDVRRFLGRLPDSCRALLTSRRRPDLDGTRVVELEPLPGRPMTSLFFMLAQDKGAKIAPSQAHLIPLVIEHLEGHPLAVTFVVPYLVDTPLKDVWADLQARPLRGVEVSLAFSYDKLDDDQRMLFTRLSVFTIPIERQAATAMSDLTSPFDVLRQLVRGALLQFDGVHYRYHALVRQYAYARLSDREDPRPVHRLAAEYLQAKITDKERGGTPEEVLEEVDQWEQAEAWEPFARRASALVGSLDRVGYWPEIMEHLERARAAVVTHLDDAKLEATLLNAMGILARKRGEWERAIAFYEKDLEISERVGDIHGMAQTYGNLGSVYMQKGEWERAIAFYEKDLEISERVGDIHGMAGTYNNLGSVYARKGEWERAIAFYENALEIDEQVGDLHGMAVTYMNIGNVYYQQGKWDEAIEQHQKSLEIREKVGDIHGMAQTYNNLGLVYADKGEWDRAIEFYEKALETMERVGDIHGMASTYGNLGIVYRRKGEWERAIAFYEKTLQTMERVGDIHGMASTYGNLGTFYAEQVDTDQAAQYYAQAFLIFAQLGAAPQAQKAGGLLAQLLGSAEKAQEYVDEFLRQQE